MLAVQPQRRAFIATPGSNDLESYEGTWEEDQRHGYGVWRCNDGRRLVPCPVPVREGKACHCMQALRAISPRMCSLITVHLQNGLGLWLAGAVTCRYEGYFRKNRFHGHGVYTIPYRSPNLLVKYVGGWADGERCGIGTYTFGDGTEEVRTAQ